MKTIMNKIIIFIIVILLLLSNSVIYASMADFTDEQADKATKQNQEEWKQEQEQRINKSSNNYLKYLSVKNYNITPEFDKQTINYEIKQEITDNYLEIIAETDDEKASVSGNGKIELYSGENELRVDVTAENGTVRTYFIKVITNNGKEKNTSTEEENNIESDSHQEPIQQSEKNVNYKLIAIGLLGVVAACIITFIGFKRKHKKIGKH